MVDILQGNKSTEDDFFKKLALKMYNTYNRLRKNVILTTVYNLCLYNHSQKLSDMHCKLKKNVL